MGTVACPWFLGFSEDVISGAGNPLALAAGRADDTDGNGEGREARRDAWVVDDQVLGRLNRAGLVGVGGGERPGWLLTHPPEQVSLYDVTMAMDAPFRACSCERATPENRAKCPLERLSSLWLDSSVRRGKPRGPRLPRLRRHGAPLFI